MRKSDKEILRLTARQTLLSVFSLALPFFEASRVYRIGARQFKEEIECEHSNFADRIRYLRRHGLIETFVEGKEEFVEITPKGMGRVKVYQEEIVSIARPESWDGKWRVIIFDIPNKRKVSRDVLRCKLINLGFVKIQESVYVYPFECTREISSISNRLGVTDSVLIMISEIIQGETEIIESFLSSGILTQKDLKRK